MQVKFNLLRLAGLTTTVVDLRPADNPRLLLLLNCVARATRAAVTSPLRQPFFNHLGLDEGHELAIVAIGAQTDHFASRLFEAGGDDATVA